MLSSAAPPPVESPCIKVCVLDTGQVCRGCGRSLQEIAGWSRMTVEEQRQTCERAASRRLRQAALAGHTNIER